MTVFNFKTLLYAVLQCVYLIIMVLSCHNYSVRTPEGGTLLYCCQRLKHCDVHQRVMYEHSNG